MSENSSKQTCNLLIICHTWRTFHVFKVYFALRQEQRFIDQPHLRTAPLVLPVFYPIRYFYS